jgi:hypothetical protein
MPLVLLLKVWHLSSHLLLMLARLLLLQLVPFLCLTLLLLLQQTLLQLQLPLC